MEDNRRDQLKTFVEREFIGPDPIDWEGLRQENGEEILISDPPRTRYIAGILFPKESKEDNNAEEERKDEDIEIEDESDDGKIITPNRPCGFLGEYLEDAEELIDRSNAYNQSAMSLTVAISLEDEIIACVEAGIYNKSTETNSDNQKVTTKYSRTPIVWSSLESLILPSEKEGIKRIPVDDTGLRIDITFRFRKDDYCIYTITLENTKEMKDMKVRDEDCFFQVKLKIESKMGFHFLPEGQRINADEDFLSNELLYRNVRNYAIGHGCAAEWDEVNESVKWIETSVFPSYEVKPVVPSTISGVNLSMLDMSNVEHFSEVICQLHLLCEKYRIWIDKLEKQKMELDNKYLETAERHITNCKVCQKRMENGVSILENDEIVQKAFQWMNQAMFMQQLHYGLPLQIWIDDGDDGIKLESSIESMPDIYDESTWYKKEQRIYGKWRPFQIAFILMNLESMSNKKGKERKIVDLIWFPTGGGKTEAYLGLSAFTIFVRRLRNKDDIGTAIIMRYTLRLLTAQQYERAAAMICACEVIRRDNKEVLGEEEINIGLWVGGDTTPNHMKDAVAKYDDLYNHRTNINPFVMLKCPWCGAQMGVVDIGGKRKLPGYRIITGARKSKKFIFRCTNTEKGCVFSSGTGLPLYIIDDDIYEKAPTLVLGTVDKFAMLPYKPEAQSIFGYKNGEKVTSPDLIIQDELHLISGPLGSMVGHYETMIHDLCTERLPSGNISPKIIASTATISRAKEQCHALYGCKIENVFQFPPAGLDAGDSFFANEDKTKNGRKYVGILASGSPSDATTAIRLFSALLYAAKTMKVENEKDRDPYWTNVGYYNSIRELGNAQTWIKADIEQHLDVMYKRRYDDKRMDQETYKAYRRYIWHDEELTSRIPGDKVTASLSNLNIGYPPKLNEDGKAKEYPIDICLATNMISVGLDVQRLGLMTVAGQPKTTSEYIQATSRVGRDAQHAPGLIFVLYRPGRPRDKSFYEQFKLYHSKLYCHVEPTSVTPFSTPIRERALHAIIIGMMRLEHGEQFNQNPPKLPRPEVIEHVKAVIENRVNDIDPEELSDTLKRMEYVLQCWEDWNPQRWTPQMNYDHSMGNAVPLIYSSSNKPNAIWNERGLKTPTSMRSVDASCEAMVIKNRYVERDE
ncbi:MAG: hypothetical protein K2O91_21235 [Lachnospiraceae bacterium]|nr:hypothetical protein [Lachnospiraceae bacterium]